MHLLCREFLYAILQKSKNIGGTDNNIIIYFTPNRYNDRVFEQKCLFIAVNECKSIWRGLRNSYIRSIRQHKIMPHKRKWYLCDNMSFLSAVPRKQIKTNLIVFKAAEQDSLHVNRGVMVFELFHDPDNNFVLQVIDKKTITQ